MKLSTMTHEKLEAEVVRLRAENEDLKLRFAQDGQAQTPPILTRGLEQILLETIPQGIVEVDIAGRIIFANKAYHKILKVQPGTLIGKSVFSHLMNEKTRQDARNYVVNLIKTRPEAGFLITHLNNSKSELIDIQIDWNYKLNAKGKIIGFISVVTDITERRKTNKALKNSERNLRALFTAMKDIVLEINSEGRYVNIAPTSPNLLYKASKELKGKTLHELFSPDEANKFLAAIKESLTKMKVVKIEYQLEINKELIWFEARIAPKTASTVIFIASDISERKENEYSLINSEKRYKDLFDQSPASIWEEDYSELYAYLQELRESGVLDFKKYFQNNPEEVKKCSKLAKIIDINQMTKKLFHAKDRNALITGLDTIFTEESLPPFIEQLCSIANNERQFKGETVNRTLDGKLLNVTINFNVVPGHEHDYSKVLVSLIDITEQKRAEALLRTGRERLKLLNKIIRHDISNDFNVITSAMKIYKRTENPQMLDEISKRVEKSFHTISNYKNYEAFIDANTALVELDLNDLLIRLSEEFPKLNCSVKGKGKVFADKALDSVFMNLFSNSLRHGLANEVSINLSNVGSMCRIDYTDNGRGIPPMISGQVFDEGFYFGDTGHTGIGLHIVKKTIERYGGTISLADNYPNGAVFLIQLRRVM